MRLKESPEPAEQGLGLDLPPKNILLFQSKKREASAKGIEIYLGSLTLTNLESDTVRLIYLGR